MSQSVNIASLWFASLWNPPERMCDDSDDTIVIMMMMMIPVTICWTQKLYWVNSSIMFHIDNLGIITTFYGSRNELTNQGDFRDVSQQVNKLFWNFRPNPEMLDF